MAFPFCATAVFFAVDVEAPFLDCVTASFLAGTWAATKFLPLAQLIPLPSPPRIGDVQRRAEPSFRLAWGS